jgi:hypothetical protein
LDSSTKVVKEPEGRIQNVVTKSKKFNTCITKVHIIRPKEGDPTIDPFD